MVTKLGWYLNPFYPAFAVAVGWTVVWGLTVLAGHASRWRWRAAVAIVVLAGGLAEGRLLWHSHRKASMHGTAQALILSGVDTPGVRVFRRAWEHGDRFVLEHIRGGRAVMGSAADFLASTGPDDRLLSDDESDAGRFVEVRREGRYALYRRR